MLESGYQKLLVKKIKRLFEGCIVLKNDSSYKQGVPDLLILFGHQWAALEVKKDKDAPPRPNQPYWVNQMNLMSFSAFIYPENEEEVLHALQHTFGTLREARVPKR